MSKTKRIVLIIVLVLMSLAAVLYVAYWQGSKIVIRESFESYLTSMLEDGSLTTEELSEMLVEDSAVNGNTEPPPSIDGEGMDETVPVEKQEPQQEEKNTATVQHNKNTNSSQGDLVAQVAKKAEQSIPAGDRNAMLGFVSRLSGGDIQYLAGLLVGGLSAAEKNKAVEIALSKYSPAEIKILQGYYYKYIHLVH